MTSMEGNGRDFAAELEAFSGRRRRQEERLGALCGDLAERMRVADSVRVAPGVQREPPTEAQWDAAMRSNGNPLLSGWLVLIIHRWGRSVQRAPFQVAYWHRDFGALLSRLDHRGIRAAAKIGDVGLIAFDDRGELSPLSTSSDVATGGLNLSRAESLDVGCTACGMLWRHPDAHRQCRRCKRCLACCANEGVRNSCSWRGSHPNWP